METKKIPTSVYAEVTPNPNTVKFVANRVIMPFSRAIEFKTAEEVKNHAPLATQLFNFPFVQSLFFSTNFVSVTKTDAVDWDLLTMQVREFIQEYLLENEWAVVSIPEDDETEAATQQENKEAPKVGHAMPTNEIEEKIVEALDEYIRPAVESDGGAIDFKSFSDGKLEVVLRGSCSGCPSSVVTLKNGIETLMQNMIPQVKEVVAHEH
ncbi:NifU family protein [Luteibaculum oceani]|uniref:NifU family protein n=1 Tax=Luteibaculum oceani TaxID=1294296 RepID=A0A5C6V525_9FLAO|nr:NifU family protein [Luteibaculum oceani]TXC78898.1 NifU family protein [Luteibaculum oceani]